MSRNLSGIVVFLFVLTVISSCKKELDVPSTHLVPVAGMWKVKNDARSAVFATYGLLRAALANDNAYFVYGELRAGDFTGTSNFDLKAVASNNLNVTSATMEEWKSWRRFYAVIAQANICIEKLPIVQKNDFRYSDDEMALDIANVRFVRALAYFYLVRIWGDVPLITKTSETGFKPIQRKGQRTVLDFAKQEVLAILKSLPWQYNGQFPEQQGNYWGQTATHWWGIVATKGAAYDLLAHIAAWRGNYLDVENYTRIVMDNKTTGGYDFASIADLTNANGGVFLGEASDVIFSLPFDKDYQESSNTGHIEQWTLATPYVSRQIPDIYIPNDTIQNIFNEQRDERFYIDTSGGAHGDYFTGFGRPVPVFSKIRELSISGDVPFQNYQSSIVIFRYEELVLLRAEAYLFLGKPDEAIQLLNSIRTHRGLLEFKDGDGSVAGAIRMERRRELLGEGWRWFDLVRFGKVSEYTGFTQQDIQNGALLWPVSSDIVHNSGIEQNSYWQH